MREEWIDRWRGLLICLVVIGHAVGFYEHVYDGFARHGMALVYKVIYTFHMPAFFCLAGLLWKDNNKDWVALKIYVIKKAKRLLVPYFVFGVISLVLFCIAQKVVLALNSASSDGYYAPMSFGGVWCGILAIFHGGGWPNGNGFRCNSVLWFLPCLFSTGVAYWFVDKYINSRLRLAIVVATLLAYACFYGVFRFVALPWGLTLVPHYMLFVILGRHMAKSLVCKTTAYCNGVAMLILWLVFAVCVSQTPDRYQAVKANFLWTFPFFALTCAGCLLSALLAQTIRSAWLARFGVASIGIMLMHKPILIPLQLVLARIDGCRNMGYCIAAIVVSTVTTLVLSLAATNFILRHAPWLLGKNGDK